MGNIDRIIRVDDTWIIEIECLDINRIKINLYHKETTTLSIECKQSRIEIYNAVEAIVAYVPNLNDLLISKRYISSDECMYNFFNDRVEDIYKDCMTIRGYEVCKQIGDLIDSLR